MRMRVRHHPLGFLELGVVVQLTRELGIDDFDRHAGLVECSERGLRALDLELVGQCPGERGLVRGGVRRDAVRFELRGSLWVTHPSDADPAITGFVPADYGRVVEPQASAARPLTPLAVLFGDGDAGSSE